MLELGARYSKICKKQCKRTQHTCGCMACTFLRINDVWGIYYSYSLVMCVNEIAEEKKRTRRKSTLPIIITIITSSINKNNSSNDDDNRSNMCTGNDDDDMQHIHARGMTSARNKCNAQPRVFSANIFRSFHLPSFDKVFWARTVFTSLIFPKARRHERVEKWGGWAGGIHSQPNSIGFDDQYETPKSVSVNEQANAWMSQWVGE